MRAGVIVTGVLGLGTVLVFVTAALTAALFPGGTVISNGMNGVQFDRGFGGGKFEVPMPVPAPDVFDVDPDINVRGMDGDAFPNDFQPLPGDIVVTDPTTGVDVVPVP